FLLGRAPIQLRIDRMQIMHERFELLPRLCEQELQILGRHNTLSCDRVCLGVLQRCGYHDVRLRAVASTGFSFWITARETFPYAEAVQVAITFLTTAYGSDLSASTVISRDAMSWSLTTPPATDGRPSTARNGSISGALESRISVTSLTSSPCTNN